MITIIGGAAVQVQSKWCESYDPVKDQLKSKDWHVFALLHLAE
jgi:hypothetical protein